MQRTADVDALVLQQLRQIQRVGRHGAIVTGAIAHQIQRAVCQPLLRRAGDGLRVGHIERERLAAGVLSHEVSEPGLLTCRYAYLRATRMQKCGHGAPNAAGRADQPDAPATPVGDGRIEGHGVTPS